MEALAKGPDHRQYPRVYADLQYLPGASGYATACVVKDPKTARYFRFSQGAMCLIQAMDGTYSVEELGIKLGVSSDAIRAVVDRLAQLRLLDEGLDPVALRECVQAEQKQRQLWINRVLLIRKDIVHPDVWIERTYRRLGMIYIFKPWLGVALIALCIGAYLVYRNNAFAMTRAVQHLLNPAWLPLGVGVWIAVSVLHELAHGFACKHFGGTIHSMGVGLYYFQFVFYCDVTDAWTFSQRYQRLITHGAGLLMNLFLASLAVLMLPFAGDHPLLEATAAMVFVISGVRSLTNLNPLVRLDGYFLLADALGIDNLRDKAFRHLFASLRRILCRAGLLKGSPTPDTGCTRRDRRILLPYALLSLGYITVMLCYLGYQLGKMLAPFIGIWGWVVSFSSVSIILVVPMWNGWKKSGTRERSSQGMVA